MLGSSQKIGYLHIFTLACQACDYKNVQNYTFLENAMLSRSLFCLGRAVSAGRLQPMSSMQTSSGQGYLDQWAKDEANHWSWPDASAAEAADALRNAPHGVAAGPGTPNKTVNDRFAMAEAIRAAASVEPILRFPARIGIAWIEN
ncbi:MAG: hypothetical protein R3C97_16450 [Geminicoccaceae bacterium]